MARPAALHSSKAPLSHFLLLAFCFSLLDSRFSILVFSGAWMLELIVVSLIWAFSFGLIKDNLSALNSNFVSFARLALPLLVFLPLLHLRRLPWRTGLKLALTGAVQYGLMYISYIYSFEF